MRRAVLRIPPLEGRGLSKALVRSTISIRALFYRASMIPSGDRMADNFIVLDAFRIHPVVVQAGHDQTTHESFLVTEGLELLATYRLITDEGVRKSVLSLVHVLAAASIKGQSIASCTSKPPESP